MKRTILTARECEVLRLIAEGKRNYDAATVLGITTTTVKFHLNAIRTKLDAESTTHAVAMAVYWGLITCRFG